MKDNDTLNLVKLVAGNNYRINSCINNQTVNVTHLKCGHTFDCSIRKIARNGLNCTRCNSLSSDKLFQTVAEIKSLSLYDKCMACLPKGYSIYGKTSTIDDVITVVWPGGDNFEITVKDLLEEKNLPDCLLHRDKNLVPSVQLQLMDKLMPTHKEILDDFESLTSEVRVKDNTRGVIFTSTVDNLIQEHLDTVDKNSKSYF